MESHAPPEYNCPFCRLARGEEDAINREDCVVHRDAHVLALIAPKWWVNNPGHVLVVPTQHYENLYTIPDDVLGRVYTVAKRVAVAMRLGYPCAGTSTRQHNEPAGNQDVWHFHVHVYPRHHSDALYLNHENSRWVTTEERLIYAEKLRVYLDVPQQ